MIIGSQSTPQIKNIFLNVDLNSEYSAYLFVNGFPMADFRNQNAFNLLESIPMDASSIKHLTRHQPMPAGPSWERGDEKIISDGLGMRLARRLQ